MISTKDRLINQLLGTIYKDKNDASIIRINMDNAAAILSNHGFNLPAQVFEQKLQALLDKKLPGVAKVTKATFYGIALLIHELAVKMHIEEREIIKYMAEHNTEQDVKELQSKIESWRKEYYGSMSGDQKQALLNALSDKLRPDVLDQIRKA